MDQIEEFIENVKRKFSDGGWGFLKLLAVLSGGYMAFDIVLGFARLTAPDEVSDFTGGQVKNSAKPFVIWISDVVHSNTMFGICLAIMIIWFIVLKNRKN